MNSIKTASERATKLTDLVNNNETLDKDIKAFLTSMLSIEAEDRPTVSEALKNEWFGDL